MALVTLKLFILTWNVAQQSLDTTPGTILDLPPPPGTPYPDLYVIGLQEMGTMQSDWVTAFDSIMSQHQYEKLAWERLRGMFSGIMVQVFIRRQHSGNIKLDETASVSTGKLNGAVPNKGASVVRLVLYNTPVCFVASHLAPHDDKVNAENYNKRLEQMNTIKNGIMFKTQPKEILKHDLVFWFGDLNFRLHQDLDMEHSQIVDSIKTKNYNQLLGLDEIRIAMARRQLFDMKEAEINFPPTFKFVKREDSYDTKRLPAWTDRILFKDVDNAVVPSKYTSVGTTWLSDHRPVYGVYDVKINT